MDNQSYTPVQNAYQPEIGDPDEGIYTKNSKMHHP